MTTFERASYFLISLLINSVLDKMEDCTNWAGINYAQFCALPVNLSDYRDNGEAKEVVALIIEGTL